MRYQFVDEHREQFAVTSLCCALGLKRSGYYSWRDRPESRRSRENRRLVVEMRVIHRQYDRRYGSPRMAEELRSRGLRCGEHRVARLMRQAGIRAKAPRRFRVTTDSGHQLPVAANVLNQAFSVSQPNAVWASDITYIWTSEGWLYLAVVLDLHSRQVVGWASSGRIDTDLTLLALERAVRRRQLVTPPLHHSDRGKQYAAERYQKVLTDHGIQCSMSRRGNCWDNAVVESFFASLKKELIHGERFETRQAAQVALFDYIEVFYNRVRRHSTLGQLSPAEFEQSQDPTLKNCPLF
jgi:transposase InsO family protein